MDFSRYQNEAVLKVLNEKPTYFGQEYAAMLSQGWTPPEWIGARLSHLPPHTTFPLRHNPECYEMIPEAARADVISRIRKFSDPMTTAEIAAMKKWDQISLS
jgi:hypothetical protein